MKITKFEIVGLNTSGETCEVSHKGRIVDLLQITDAMAELMVKNGTKYLVPKAVKPAGSKADTGKE